MDMSSMKIFIFCDAYDFVYRWENGIAGNLPDDD